MQEITIKLLTISELSDKAKETALEQYRDINTDHNWWNYIYDDFKEICNKLGIDAETKNMHFTGFYSQGDGSTFSAVLNVPLLVAAIRNKAWQSYAPNIEFSFPTITINGRLLKLFEKGLIDQPEIKSHQRAHYVTVDQPCYFQYNRKTNFSNIDRCLDEMVEWLVKVAETLNHFLYKSLEEEYESLTSDDGVYNAIEANEYLFTEDGKKANHLLKFVQAEQ